jgi:hypothetical protein
VNRAVLHKKKRVEASAKNKKEIATLLEQGKDALARVKTTAIVFEDYMVEVLNMVAIYCQTLVQRKDVMKLQQVRSSASLSPLPLSPLTLPTKRIAPKSSKRRAARSSTPRRISTGRTSSRCCA